MPAQKVKAATSTKAAGGVGSGGNSKQNKPIHGGGGTKEGNGFNAAQRCAFADACKEDRDEVDCDDGELEVPDFHDVDGYKLCKDGSYIREVVPVTRNGYYMSSLEFNRILNVDHISDVPEVDKLIFEHNSVEDITTVFVKEGTVLCLIERDGHYFEHWVLTGNQWKTMGRRIRMNSTLVEHGLLGMSRPYDKVMLSVLRGKFEGVIVDETYRALMYKYVFIMYKDVSYVDAVDI